MNHIIGRYSIKEVENWYFEVLNEPNSADFWAGGFEEYFHLYRIAVRVVKAAGTRLRVGASAISDFQREEPRSFLRRFLESSAEEKTPLDFISGHPYPERIRQVFSSSDETRKNILWIKNMLESSAYPNAELLLDEWNNSPSSQDLIHDTAFMAPFIIKNYLSYQGLLKSLTYWCASDLFEEKQVPRKEFHGGFGLISKSGLKKPQYYAFVYLNRLGTEILSEGEDYIITRKSGAFDGQWDIQILVWNYTHHNGAYAGGDKSGLDFYKRYQVFNKARERFFRIRIPNPGAPPLIIIKTEFNREHGSVFDFWLKNGALEFASSGYLALLEDQCRPLQTVDICQNSQILTLETPVQPFGFVFYEVKHK
jgi:xylan 1,4-beta-xylosidase